jgi:pimeloyl-ACP methyl ester carboxylesterase
MNKYPIYLVLLFGAIRLEAQVTYQSVADRFQLYFNRQQSDSIFNMYSSDVKEKLPLEKNRTVMEGLHIQFGDLKALDVIQQDTGYANYKATFKDQTLTLVLALSKEGLIEGLRFIPYTSPQTPLQKMESKSNIVLKTDAGNIYGSLKVPEGNNKMPVLLIISGSGPTDRNGNQVSGLTTNTYKMIADSMLKRGIATLRFDKRGIGESVGGMKSEKELVFENYINDAAGFIRMLKSDKRFSKVIVLGHSEGSLIGMVAARTAQADAFISIAGAGDRIDRVIEEQLRSQSPEMAAKATVLFDSLNKGYSVEPEADLLYLFRPSVQPYLQSWLKYNPRKEISMLQIPVLIIQGTTDIQVAIQDAQMLKSACPSAKLVLINQMNHVLKQSGFGKQENMSTYNNPELPVKTELINAVDAFVRTVK